MSIFDKPVDRRGTFCTQWDYTVDRFGRDDVLPFSISDMDFELPKSTTEVLINSVSRGVFGYTRWRHDDFKSSVTGWYHRRFDYQLNPDYITYSPTVIYSLAELLRMRSKDVLLFTPAYDAFFGVLKENGCNPVMSELQINNNRFEINRDQFDEVIKSVDTLLFCSPHNPVGKIFDREELEYIVEKCKENNVFIISDEIHMDVSFGKQHIPLLKIAETYNYQDNCVIITSATKSFNFPGLLFSYALIPNQQLKTQFETSLKVKNGLSSCTTLGLLATIDVYTNGDQWLDELNEYLFGNYTYAKQFIETNIPQMKIYEFDGTYLLWIDSRAYEQKFEQLIDIMYNQTKVGIMDGSVYGMDNFLRINIGCQRSKLEEGLKRFKQAVDLLENN